MKLRGKCKSSCTIFVHVCEALQYLVSHVAHRDFWEGLFPIQTHTHTHTHTRTLDWEGEEMSASKGGREAKEDQGEGVFLV